MSTLWMYAAGMWGMLAVTAIYDREPVRASLWGSGSGILFALAHV